MMVGMKSDIFGFRNLMDMRLLETFTQVFECKEITSLQFVEA